jgi:hypothetical protein
MEHLKRFLIASSEEWGVSPRIATWIFGVPFIGAVLVAVAQVNVEPPS